MKNDGTNSTAKQVDASMALTTVRRSSAGSWRLLQSRRDRRQQAKSLHAIAPFTRR
jgi:hypothetical protein